MDQSLFNYYAPPERKLQEAIEEAKPDDVKTLLSTNQGLANQCHKIDSFLGENRSYTVLSIVPLLYVAHCYDELPQDQKEQLKDKYFKMAQLLYPQTNMEKVVSQYTHYDTTFGGSDFKHYPFSDVLSNNIKHVKFSDFEIQFLKQVMEHERH